MHNVPNGWKVLSGKAMRKPSHMATYKLKEDIPPAVALGMIRVISHKHGL